VIIWDYPFTVAYMYIELKVKYCGNSFIGYIKVISNYGVHISLFVTM